MSFAPIEIDALARRDSILSAKKTHKNLEDEKKRLENAPSDPYHLVHLVFFFVGMMNWLPMLFFLTAQDYWMYKFRDTSQADYDLNHKTVLQQNFSSAQNLISTVPSLIANLLSARYGHKISMRTRLMVSSLIVFAAFAIFTAFIKIDTDSWQMGFFIMTMTVITLLTMNSALWMLSSLTLVSRFPETYLKVNQYGSNATGIISAVLQLIALSTNGTSTTVALIYFTCGTALVGVNAALTYLAFKLPRFIYFLGDVKQDTEKPTQNLKQIRAVARKMWPIAVMSVVGVITFGFSGISVSGMIVSEEYPNTLWSRKYFIPVINFLLINVVSFIACIFSGPYITPKNAPYIMTLDLCRQIFIGPLVLFCNLKTTNRHLPTLFKHDYQYIIITTVNNFLMSLSITCGLMSTQNLMPEDPEQGFLFMTAITGTIMPLASPLTALWVNII